MSGETSISQVRARRLAALVLVAVCSGVTTQRIVGSPLDGPAQTPPPASPPAGVPPAPVANPVPPRTTASLPGTTLEPGRPVAMMYGNVTISQEEFGRFLMERGGAEKLELFVNKRIIEEEARRLGVTVSKEEMMLALEEDLAGIGVKKAEFLQIVLPKYGKSWFEWMEDVIRPRLLISKMCRKRMDITEADLRLQFERRYGEQRRVQIIMWPAGENPHVVNKAYEDLRKGQAEFDHAARAQANPALAAACGHIKPITKHLTGEDKRVEELSFALKKDELSHILKTQQGYMVMKLHEIIPPRTDVTFEKEKPSLEKAAYEEKLTNEIPKLFAEMKARAKPDLLYRGPADWQMPQVQSPTPSILPTGGAVIQPPTQVSGPTGK